MIRTIAVLTTGFFLLSGSAMAELCDDPKTQADINYCAKYHADRADAELNEIYGKLKTAYGKNPDAKSALVKSQRAWLVFRDAECNQDKVAADGGSAAPVIALECNTRMTTARTNQLQDRFLCKEGDMSCVTLGNAAD